MYVCFLTLRILFTTSNITFAADLGPPGLSSKYKPGNNDSRGGGDDRRDYRRGDSRDRRDRRDRSRSRDRDSRRRDDYDRYPPRDYRGGGGGYGAPRIVVDPSYYPRYSLPMHTFYH